jgi:hypothetical protein
VKSRLNWANRNAGPFGVFILVFVGCVFLHFVAHFKMEMANRHFVVMDARAIYEMRTIDFIETHRWLALVYAGTSVFTAIWLTVKFAPRWLFQLCAIAYALPCAIYPQPLICFL